MKQDIWIWSDPHFGHKNIMKYCDRDFKSVEEMNDYMIKQYNSVVKHNDICYILGDISLCRKDEDLHIVKKFVDQLNGIKYLVKGNHDHYTNKQYLDIGFEWVYDQTIIVDNFWILSHRPIEFLSPHQPMVNIHGHVHRNSYDNKQFVNVSVEVLEDYKPILFDDIKKQFADD